MQVAFIGAGGVGGYFGGLLARKGVAVHLVARGRHLEAIRREGLRVEAASGTFHARPASAEPDARAVAHCDVVFVSVKNYDFDSALEQLRSFAGERACFVPVLNGIDAFEKLSRAFPERTVPGLCNVLAEIAEPGVIRQAPGPQQIILGEPDGRRTGRLTAIAELFSGTGAEVLISDSIAAALWTKMIYISGFAGVVAATRSSVGEVLACAESRALCLAALREAASVAEAEGVVLGAGIAEAMVARGAALEPGTKLSLLRDIEAGRRTEIESFSGALVRRGQARGIATPVHGFLYAALLPGHLRGCPADSATH